MITESRTCNDQKLFQDIERLKRHRQLFRSRMELVLHQQSDIRHLIAIPVNPRGCKVVLRDSEKHSRVGQVSGKRSEGFYQKNNIVYEDVAEKILARLWNLHIEE